LVASITEKKLAFVTKYLADHTWVNMIILSFLFLIFVKRTDRDMIDGSLDFVLNRI
jgi:hypothetical protein